MQTQLSLFRHKQEISSGNRMYTISLGLIQRPMHGSDSVIVFQRLMSYSFSPLVETELQQRAQSQAYTHRFTERYEINN